MVGRKCTTELLARLRQLMRDSKYVKEPLQAYIVPWADAHNSEYLAECDQQRAFISGFTGSAGTAVVTEREACLWTDGRYYLQASQQLDSNWTLMKESLPSTPSQAAWLSKTLPAGSRIGANPMVLTQGAWKPLNETLSAAGHKLIPVEADLVAAMWPDRPPRPDHKIKHLSDVYNGRSVHQKLSDVRSSMKEAATTALVITALDEVAWLLNLRGSDIEYCPVFFAYIILTPDAILLFTHDKKIEDSAMEYLRAECGANLSIHPYEAIKERLAELANNPEDTTKIWFSTSAPYGLTACVPEKRLLAQATPVSLMKAIKNETESAGMRNAHVKDGAALCRFFSWLEREIIDGEKPTELSAAAALEAFRKEQPLYMGASFETISASGPNGAIVHYKPVPETDSPITDDKLYLCDSGGQYLDGTTDVTRTVHHGMPTDYERECFTRVLKGQMALAEAIFPERIKGNCLDSYARRFLWDVGLDYQHGTGHGIGHYLNVHEGPMGISWRVYPEDPGLQAGMFLSDEPGYYEDGSFGIRLENIVQVMEADTPYKYDGRKFLTFETVTLCPIQTKMLSLKLLTAKERASLNAYHDRCRRELSPLLAEHPEALAWLERETRAV